MLGQEKLVEQFNSYTLSTFPKTCMLLGEVGSGKHTLANYVSNHLGIDLIDITENISTDTINEMCSNTVPTMYLINIDEVSYNKQNTLLKVLEEPVQCAYIMLLSTTTDNRFVLETILNRCIVFNLEKYSKETLKQFVTKKELEMMLLDIADTPGQLITLQQGNVDYDAMYNLADTIIEKMNIANYANMLTIVTQFNFKDEYDKYDPVAFLKVMCMKLRYKIQLAQTKKEVNLYTDLLLRTTQIIELLPISRFNKENMFTSYLCQYWEDVRKER